MKRLVFLDTETTGLDPIQHDVFEVAWATEESDVRAAFLPHTLTGADPKALDLNGYRERIERPFDALAAVQAEEDLKRDLQGATIVGANPHFDALRLFQRWGSEPWHYRLLDVEAFAMPILGYDFPQGLATIVEDLGSLGQHVFPSDHTAANDVLALRDAFYALWELRDGETVQRGTFGGSVAR